VQSWCTFSFLAQDTLLMLDSPDSHLVRSTGIAGTLSTFSFQMRLDAASTGDAVVQAPSCDRSCR